jgi:hypothetical protein
MIGRRTGLIAGVALATGLAIGAVGSTAAASPSFDPSHRSMMNGASFAPDASFGPGMMDGSGTTRAGMMGWGSGAGMMGSLSTADRQKLLDQCDEIHDAMHAALNVSPAPSSPPKS